MAEDVATGKLLYRAGDHGRDWKWLNFGSVDGWNMVASDILEQEFDTVREFSRMHMIRRRDLPTDEVAEAYDLAGIIWWVRPGGSGLEACLGDGDWTSIDVTAGMPARERAICAVFGLVPDMTERLLAPSRDWAMRMAQSVQVTPIISMAAE